MTTLSEHLLQCLGLRDRTGETVEDHAFVLFAEAVVDAGQNVDHQVVGDQLTVVDIFFCCLAQLSAVLDLVAQHVAGRDMFETILSDHLVALCALA